jgi:hypothetical protein
MKTTTVIMTTTRKREREKHFKEIMNEFETK